MVDLCLHLHHPQFLKQLSVFDMEHTQQFYDEHRTRTQIARRAQECYLPVNKYLQQLSTEKNIAICTSGTTLDLLQKYAPDVIQSFAQLAPHLTFINAPHQYSATQQQDQYEHHAQTIQRLFNKKPTIITGAHMQPPAATHTATITAQPTHTGPVSATLIQNNTKTTIPCIDYHYFNSNHPERFTVLTQPIHPKQQLTQAAVQYSELQEHVLQTVQALQPAVINTNNQHFIDLLHTITSHDHIQQLNTATFDTVHPEHTYESTYEAYMLFMNILETITQHTKNNTHKKQSIVQ